MHTGRAGKLQKHHEGGLGADSQEGRKKTTKSKKAIGQKLMVTADGTKQHSRDSPRRDSVMVLGCTWIHCV